MNNLLKIICIGVMLSGVAYGESWKQTGEDTIKNRTGKLVDDTQAFVQEDVKSYAYEDYENNPTAQANVATLEEGYDNYIVEEGEEE